MMGTGITVGLGSVGMFGVALTLHANNGGAKSEYAAWLLAVTLIVLSAILIGLELHKRWKKRDMNDDSDGGSPTGDGMQQVNSAAQSASGGPESANYAIGNVGGNLTINERKPSKADRAEDNSRFKQTLVAVELGAIQFEPDSLRLKLDWGPRQYSGARYSAPIDLISFAASKLTITNMEKHKLSMQVRLHFIGDVGERMTLFSINLDEQIAETQALFPGQPMRIRTSQFEPSLYWPNALKGGDVVGVRPHRDPLRMKGRDTVAGSLVFEFPAHPLEQMMKVVRVSRVEPRLVFRDLASDKRLEVAWGPPSLSGPQGVTPV